MIYAAQKEVVLQAYSCLLKTRMLPGNAKKMTAYAFTATPDLKKKYAKKNVHVLLQISGQFCTQAVAVGIVTSSEIVMHDQK